MTPQERELISGLFDRLTHLESQPRDPEAERAIAEGLRGAPNAIYPLVQTVLVQDEALKAANARIEDLEAEAGRGLVQSQPRGFLDSMRDALLGSPAVARARSVPSVRPAGAGPEQAAYSPGVYPQGAAAPSFLGTAAAGAAGIVGGALLLNGIRSMLGGHGHGHGPFAGTFDSLRGGDYASNDTGPEVDGSGGLEEAGFEGGSRDQDADLVDTTGYGSGDFGSFDSGSDEGSD